MHMNALQSVGHSVASERGAALPWFVLWLPVLVLFLVFVVDVGHWFEHKRHLQLQADAGALAGAGDFKIPCSPAQGALIEAAARKYAGDPDATAPYNSQVPPTEPGNVHVLINSTDYWNEGGTNHSDGGDPCETSFIDVKITEADLPLFFRIPGLFSAVPAINAHARVEILKLTTTAGALPVAVPDINPTVARAYFVDETNCDASGCAVIASTPLTKAPDPVNGLAVWDNLAAPVSVPINSARIGVRIALGGASSTTCGDPLVDCYDLDSQNGIVFIRGYPPTGREADTSPPVARDVRLSADGCSDGYFFKDASTCTVMLSAEVSRGSVPPASFEITAFGGECPNSGCALTYDATADRWIGAISVASEAGPAPITLKWQQIGGSITSFGTCSATFKSNNPCQDFFESGTASGPPIQRGFSATEPRSGPVEVAEIWEGGLFGANSFERGTTHSLAVRIGIKGSLENASSVNDPVVTIRVTGSQNQSVDCDPDQPNLADEIRYGCAPSYTVNNGTPCPSTGPALWSLPQPWNCVAVQTGGAVGQVEKGMRDRILGGSNTCTNPNNWSQFPNLPPEDPRIVPLFLTPFGTFSGSGNAVFPVTGFSAFYVTGWFGSPCTDDDPAPAKGHIVGHFIKYIYQLNNGGGTGTCNATAFGSCIAVLTE
jgi:hypothetical protein